MRRKNLKSLSVKGMTDLIKSSLVSGPGILYNEQESNIQGEKDDVRE